MNEYLERIKSKRFDSREKKAILTAISPGIAKTMLEASGGNRKLRKWYVDALANVMIRGEFRVTAECIGFTSDGTLVEGHHRLSAIVQSGKTVDMFVVYGLDHDIYAFHNIGIKRTTADLHGIRKQTAEAINKAVVLTFGSGAISQTDLVHNVGVGTPLFYALESLAEHCGANSAYFTSAPMRLAAAIHLMNGRDADFILHQWRALALSDIAAMSPASQALLRQVVQKKASAQNSMDALARGRIVFDESRQNVSRISVDEESISAARLWVKKAVNAMLSNST